MISNWQRKDMAYLSRCLEVSSSSKCIRAKYGSIIVSKDGRTISDGYNGKPRQSINDNECYRIGLADASKEKPNCCIHSEVNAIMFSSPLDRIDGTLYVSGIPCDDCLLVIMQSGIGRLVYLDAPNYIGLHGGNSTGKFNMAMMMKYGSRIKVFKYTLEDISKWRSEHVQWSVGNV